MNKATPRELRDLQVRVRAEQQTPEWKARSGAEGTINEFAHGHGMRHCRYRGQPEAHCNNVLTAIAVNIERRSGRSATEKTTSPRPPTAFQDFLDQQGTPWSTSWRTLGSRPRRQPTRALTVTTHGQGPTRHHERKIN